MMRKHAAWYLIVVLLLAYFPSEAQFSTTLRRYKKADKEPQWRLQLHKRIYLGVYGQHIMSNPLYLRIRDTAYATQESFDLKIGGVEIDTTLQTTARLKQNLTGYLGVSIPLSRITPKTMISFDIEANVIMGNITYDTFTVDKIYKTDYYSEEMPFMMFSGPISINYKYGGDATLSKEDKFMASVGAGIAPAYITVDPLGGAKQDALVKAVPFAKAELGFFLGVAWKLRATYFMGQYDLIDVKAENLNNATGIIRKQYSGPLGYNFSLKVYPLSFMWDKD